MHTRSTTVPLLPCIATSLFVFLVLTGGSQAAVGPTLKTSAGEILVLDRERGAVIQSPDGRQVTLPLSTAAKVSDFRRCGEKWFAAAVDYETAGPALRLMQGQGSTAEALPSPVDAQAVMLAQPLFVADSEALHAVVWLAGDAHHQLAVQAARWLDGTWSEPVTLSPPGKGTQIALSTATLRDGASLVVWAAFDGTDDEILWSRWLDGAWSQPRAIAEDNAVPDITPQLFTTSDGALVAWSRYDGNDYRVNVSRFDGESWSRPVVVGPKGSTAPSFDDAAKPYLLYHQADPRAWGIMELDDFGKVRRQAIFQGNAAQRPILQTASAGSLVLEWVGADRKTVAVPLAWLD